MVNIGVLVFTNKSKERGGNRHDYHDAKKNLGLNKVLLQLGDKYEYCGICNIDKYELYGNDRVSSDLIKAINLVEKHNITDDNIIDIVKFTTKLIKDVKLKITHNNVLLIYTLKDGTEIVGNNII